MSDKQFKTKEWLDLLHRILAFQVFYKGHVSITIDADYDDDEYLLVLTLEDSNRLYKNSCRITHSSPDLVGIVTWLAGEATAISALLDWDRPTELLKGTVEEQVDGDDDE